MPNEIQNPAEANDATAVVDGGSAGADARGDHAVAVFESEGGALPAAGTPAEVQGLAAGVAAEEVSFEEPGRIAMRLGITKAELYRAIEGKIVLVIFAAGGTPRLRTADVNRLIDW